MPAREVVARFYTEDASMQENLQPPRNGRAVLAAHEREVLSRKKQVRTLPDSTFLVEGNVVVIRSRFEFEYGDGRRTAMDEIACQRWSGDLIAEERFYYDPAQHQVGAPDK